MKIRGQQKNKHLPMVRLRKVSYHKKVVEDSLKWWDEQDATITFNRKSTEINAERAVHLFLSINYGLRFSSTCVKKILGKYIGKEESVYNVRVDYYRSEDVKKLLLFKLKYSAIMIEKHWYYNRKNTTTT